MSDPAFIRPDLFSIPAAEQAELATAVCGLLSADSYRPAGNNPVAPPTRDVVRTLAEAGFTSHYCHRYDLLALLARRACLMPITAESGTGPSGKAGSWTTHDLLLDWDWPVACSHTCQLMNATPGSGLHAFGYLARQRGTGGPCLATGHRGQRTEAGR
jgi:hypothetical protein